MSSIVHRLMSGRSGEEYPSIAQSNLDGPGAAFIRLIELDVDTLAILQHFAELVVVENLVARRIDADEFDAVAGRVIDRDVSLVRAEGRRRAQQACGSDYADQCIAHFPLLIS